MNVTDTAQKILEERIFQPGEKQWDDVAVRVAFAFGTNRAENDMFYHMLERMDALPNTPCLSNAGTEIKSYSACFVLPVEDSIESIFKYYTDAALISKSGGGVGANFSHLRKRGSLVGSTLGVASGPISFIGGENSLTEVIKQGGKRRGANMGILRWDHPDIMEFVKAKDEEGVLNNFNLSVLCTDDFMESVTGDLRRDHGLPDDAYTENAKYLWNEMMYRAWSEAEPGVLWGDRAERDNAVPHLGKLEATNPCGEQWLLPYESCSLISINLSNFVKTWEDHKMQDELTEVDWPRLKTMVHTAVLFMNRVLDRSEFPIPECQEAMEKTRKIGVGIMGLHDMLIQLGLPYDSEEGRKVAGDVMKFIRWECDTKSRSLGNSEGVYIGCSFFEKDGEVKGSPLRRNAALTSIQPTGTCSMIADCSSGCEPYYAPVTTKTVLDGQEFVMANKWLPDNIRQTLELHDYVKLEDLEGEGFDLKLFKGAEDIHWKDHIRMQAVLQEHVDSSISKTINMPSDCTAEDVKEAYEYAWKAGCKGLTIYRNGSREGQILQSGTRGEETGAEVCDGRDTPDTGGDSGGTAEDENSTEGQDHPDGPWADGFQERCRTTEELPSESGRIRSGHNRVQDEEGEDGGYVGFDLPTPFKLELPDKLNAQRYRVRDKDGEKVYFTVCTMDDQPVEVFARLPLDTQDSYWNTICRLLSLAMRYNIPLDDITKQLRKSSGSVSDTPSRLARILDEYKEEETWGIDLNEVNDYSVVGPEIARKMAKDLLKGHDEEINWDAHVDLSECKDRVHIGDAWKPKTPEALTEGLKGGVLGEHEGFSVHHNPQAFVNQDVWIEEAAKIDASAIEQLKRKGQFHAGDWIDNLKKEDRRAAKAKEMSCPECPGILVHSGGCEHCPSCGWEKCK